MVHVVRKDGFTSGWWSYGVANINMILYTEVEESRNGRYYHPGNNYATMLERGRLQIDPMLLASDCQHGTDSEPVPWTATCLRVAGTDFLSLQGTTHLDYTDCRYKLLRMAWCQRGSPDVRVPPSSFLYETSAPATATQRTHYAIMTQW